jgi:N-acetylmuramoyl-L-alanine amidase
MKITYDDYLSMIRDPNAADSDILACSVVASGRGAFDMALRPDPQKVKMTAEDRQFDAALKIGNGIARFRRQMRFHRRRRTGRRLPVLVSEGDSWFQFPFLIREVVDHLDDEYLIWSTGAAGDTAANMAFGPPGYGGREYLQALRDFRTDVRAFLFSAAGNDMIGADPQSGRPALLDILRPFNGNCADIHGHMDTFCLTRKLDALETAYRSVIDTIRAEPGLERLPILLHGYDYVFPSPWGDDDGRNPPYAARNAWLGGPLDALGFRDRTQRRAILGYLIDRLYDRLLRLAGSPDVTGVWVVDCRGAMPDPTHWNDEIHGTSAGFALVAQRFRACLNKALGQGQGGRHMDGF